MATARDVLAIAIVLFMTGIFFFTISFVTSQMVNAFLSVEAVNSSDAAVAAFHGTENSINRLDYVFSGVFMALILGLIVSSWFVGGNPIFMFLYFIIIGMIVVLSPVLSNSWEQYSTQSVFGSTLTLFPITNNILLNLPVYMAIIGFIGMVVMFAKPFIVGNNPGDGTGGYG